MAHTQARTALFRPTITEEVLDMITTASYTTSRQAHLAMPTPRCADGTFVRALSPFAGAIQGTGVSAAVQGGVRLVSADVRTFPGTTAWSPPT